MSNIALVPRPSRLTPVQWVICVMAAIGFAFDTYALLVLPLIVRPALMEMAKIRPGTPEFNYWVGLLFYIPAVAGGIFGLLGGYLTDRLGRRRVLVWSILLYAFSALGAGFATSFTHAAVPALHHVHRRLRGVRGGGGVAGGTVSRSEAAREGAGLHAGVLFDRRVADQRRVLPRGHVRSSRCRRSTAGTRPGATR